MDKPARAAIVGAIVAALITLPGLGSGTLWDNSETAYGEVAREIVFAHDWLVMHLNGVPYFVQPPLYFWIAAFFGWIFGTDTFALRLPSALATILMGGMTGYAVARQAGTRVGVYAAVILSSCLMQAVIGRLAIMDALLDLSVALSIFWWFRGLETGRDHYFVFGWVAAALGCLAKGPVAPAISLLVIVPYYVWNRRAETTHAPIGPRLADRPGRISRDRASVAAGGLGALRLRTDAGTAREVHLRALHGRDRKSIRAGVVLPPGHRARILPVDRLLADGRRLRRCARSTSIAPARNLPGFFDWRSYGSSRRCYFLVSRAPNCRTTWRSSCRRSRF